MWYVIQVRSGTEEEIQRQCETVIDKEILERAFVPYSEQERKYQGEWHREYKVLFPGYVFLVSKDKAELFYQLKRVIGLTKLLGTGDEIVPLSEDEIRFLTAFGREDQVVEMSEGFIENDRVVITSGPLQGNEGLIRKIDRHKRKAYLEIDMFGRKLKTQVGLEIVRKQ
ncbi:antiterminator LoaP [uncultured Merdimonas sp.]|uniref:antiterminator LoaP n=1 Tax=uncultured Merdimonas sp. TaxID=2023269 RepID=UPI00320B105A